MESPAITVVFRRQRLDGEYQDRPGGGSVLIFGSVTFARPLGGSSKVGVSMILSRVLLTGTGGRTGVRANPFVPGQFPHDQNRTMCVADDALGRTA